MKINVEFNSIEEMQAFAREILTWKQLTCQDLNESAETAQDIINKAEAKEEKKAKKPEPAPEAKTEEPKAEAVEEEKPAAGRKTESDIKVLFAAKLKAGKKAQVKDLFTKYGVAKLSELIEQNPDKLDEIYKEAEGI